MVTNNNSWSLGATPNKSLDLFGPSILIHLPGDPHGKSPRLIYVPPSHSASAHSIRSLHSAKFVLIRANSCLTFFLGRYVRSFAPSFFRNSLISRFFTPLP